MREPQRLEDTPEKLEEERVKAQELIDTGELAALGLGFFGLRCKILIYSFFCSRTTRR